MRFARVIGFAMPASATMSRSRIVTNRRNLARCATRASSFDSARVILESKVKSQPANARLLSYLGVAYAGLGRRDEAIELGGKAVDLVPFTKDNVFGVVYFETLAFIFLLVGEIEFATQQIEFLLSVPSSVSRPLLRHCSYYAPIKHLADKQ